MVLINGVFFLRPLPEIASQRNSAGEACWKVCLKEKLLRKKAVLLMEDSGKIIARLKKESSQECRQMYKDFRSL